MIKRPPAGVSIAAVLAAILLLGTALVSTRWFRSGTGELVLAPAPVRPVASSSRVSAATEVGVGWGHGAHGAAAREALKAALAQRRRKPDTLIVFATSPGALGSAVSEIRRQLGAGVRIFGGTSDSKGVLTQQGLITGADPDVPVVAMMAIASDEMVFGTGAASFANYPSPAEASKAAAAQAVRSAARGPQEHPRAVLMATSAENTRQGDVLSAIASVIGPDVPAFGGRVGAAVVDETLAGDGISVAVLYTELPVGWTFEGGYDVSSSQSGVITRMEGEESVVEIDNRPALDVYDGWLAGGLRRLYREHPSALAAEYLALMPLYIRHRSPRGDVYSIFSHVWPTDPLLQKKALKVGMKMQKGERLHLANGTWETLLNRIANLPHAARTRGDLETAQPILGFGYVCSGVMAVIPPAERLKAPLLMSQSLGGTPFLAGVSWGEHGFLPGVGNKFGNLLSSFLVIGPRPAAGTAGVSAAAAMRGRRRAPGDSEAP